MAMPNCRVLLAELEIEWAFKRIHPREFRAPSLLNASVVALALVQTDKSPVRDVVHIPAVRADGDQVRSPGISAGT
jgi:hypothetical protein